MTREEAINTVRNIYQTDKEKEALSVLIPELRESEDERIRKEIVKYFEGYTGGDNISLRFSQWIAYLEKQKENPWSEEDEAIVKTMCEEGDLKPSERAWLMNLKNRISKESLHISETCKENPDSFTDIKNRNIRGCIGMALADAPESRFKSYDVTLKDCLAYLEDVAAIPDELVKNYNLFCEQGGRELALLINAINGINKLKEPHYTKRNALFDKCVENCDPKIMQRVSDEIDEMLGKEQKPEEGTLTDFEQGLYTAISIFVGEYERDKEADLIKFVKEWSSDLLELVKDQEPAECIEDSVKFEEGFKSGRESGLRDGQKYVLDNLDSYGLCKPAEWSEEDEENSSYISAFLQTNCGENEVLKQAIIWFMTRLKSLRPQPHTISTKEATKFGDLEQERRVQEAYRAGKHELAIRFMNYLDENRPEGKMSLSNAECEDIDKAFKENDWEKILRYANKYSWKPSEEQMKWLKDVIETVPMTCRQQISLESLYNDLKKLM